MDNMDKVYELIVGISQDVGEIKAELKNMNADIKEVQDKVDKYNDDSTLADEKTMSKFYEFKNEVKDRFKEHEERFEKLENKNKNRVWAFWEKFKVALVSAIILALVSVVLKFGIEVLQLLKVPIQNTIGG